MRFKRTYLFHGISLLDNEVVQTVAIYGRSDANLKQIWYGVNKNRKRKTKMTKNQIKNSLDRLVEKDIIRIKIYKGDIIHYVLKDNLSDYERSMNE